MSAISVATRLRVLGALLILLAAGRAPAEEGGTGHYFPGSISSFIDAVPATETFVARLNVVHYKGSVTAQEQLPFAGLTTLGAEAESWGYALTLLWRPPLELGERWSYAMVVTVPYLTLEISANIINPALGGRSSSIAGLGDVLLIPLMLNYSVNPDFNAEFRLGIYAPTGSYQAGRLANTGKNFWTLEPTLGLRYFGQKNGIEASAFFGLDFNSENEDTSYKSGTQFHIDGTLAQHFPLWGGLGGAGVSGYHYQQLSGDSGSGAVLGDFKGRSVGIGPVLSYAAKIGGYDNVAELKWLHEVETKNRLKGDTVWLKWVFKFW